MGSYLYFHDLIHPIDFHGIIFSHFFAPGPVGPKWIQMGSGTELPPRSAIASLEVGGQGSSKRNMDRMESETYAYDFMDIQILLDIYIYTWDNYPGGLFIEPAFSTFAVFVIDFIPQITVVLHLSQSSISLKSTRVLFTGYVKNLSGTLFFLREVFFTISAVSLERFLWELFSHLHCQAPTCVQILPLSKTNVD